MSIRQRRYKPLSKEITALVEKFGYKTDALLEILQEIQHTHGGLSKEQISEVARALDIPEEKAYGVASFYSMLSIDIEGRKPPKKQIIRVCDSPVCWLAGAPTLHKKLDEVAIKDPGISIERSSCLGLCDRAPALLIDDLQAGPITPDLIDYLINGQVGEPILYNTPRIGEIRVMMSKAGSIDPDSIESALEHGAYCGFQKSLELLPDGVITEVETSGLTGRGGAGFPVGRKWRFVAQETRKPKYIICNADESEPLIFKDRILIDSNPHQILEGMLIAGYATNAAEGYIYIRGEYASQADRLENAISQAREQGYLGANILGHDFSFDIHVHRGAGAYICGEETALLESLEGKRGEPRLRPPYPPTYGYQGMPTLVNNVESYAAVPSIMCNGGIWYRSISDYQTPGTKMYMVLGHVKDPGLFEGPFGLTLRQIIDDFGGGMREGSAFHFALTGGAAGTIVPEHLMDVPIDYKSVAQGVSLGAGAFLVCDQTVSPADMLREILHFFMVESCGKCTPCRVGTDQAYSILSKITRGIKSSQDMEDLNRLANVLQQASFCGLGQSVATPIKSALYHFPECF